MFASEGDEQQRNLGPIIGGAAAGLGVAILVTLLALVAAVFVRRRKTFAANVSLQPQSRESNPRSDQVALTKTQHTESELANDTSEITSIRNKAYLTNAESIQLSCNAAYATNATAMTTSHDAIQLSQNVAYVTNATAVTTSQNVAYATNATAMTTSQNEAYGALLPDDKNVQDHDNPTLEYDYVTDRHWH